MNKLSYLILSYLITNHNIDIKTYLHIKNLISKVISHRQKNDIV